jgi:hypothetical protein
MRHRVGLAAFIIVLGACNKGPKVELKNATANQVASAVKQSGVMTSDTMIEPGLWQSKVVVAEMNIPGLPPEYAEKMKQSMAARSNQTRSHCITAADVKKPKEDFFGADRSCKYQHFTMGSGKIDIKMICSSEGATQTTDMSGTYTPTRYSMNMSSSGTGSGHSAISMKMHVDSERVGECTGTEG